MDKINTKISISIGITGHRDFIQTEKHSELLIDLFQNLLDNYENTPLILHSPLAEGADRFVAKIFLSFKEKYTSRIKLYVPLPNKIEIYTNDFSDNSKNEFNDLISKSDKIFSVENYSNNKNRYINVGKFIVDNSNILIAIWDGLNNGKVGGTSDIINYKKNGAFNTNEVGELSISDNSFIHLPCKRKSINDETSLRFPKDLYTIIHNNNQLVTSLKKINLINKRNAIVQIDKVETSIKSCFPNFRKLKNNEKELLSLFAVFDASAKTSQKKDRISIISLFILGGLILIFFEVYKHIGFYKAFLYLSLALIIISYFSYLTIKKYKLHQLYLESRTLAESLRVSFYWNLAGITENTSKHILRIHKSDFDWINNVLKSISGITYNEYNVNDKYKEIKNIWFTEQVNYFTKKINEIEKKVKIYNSLSKVFFTIAFVLMTSILFFNNFYEEHHFLHPLIVVIGSSFGVFALLKAYIERMGFEQIINQYELSKSLYTSASNKIDEIEKSNLSETQKNNNIKKVFVIVGKEALIEIGNWFSIYKEKGAELEGVG